MSEQRIRDLLNLGEKSERMLAAAGIETVAQLKKLGAVRAYLQVRDSGQPVSLNLLYALEGALSNTHWNRLPADVREALLMAVDAASDPDR